MINNNFNLQTSHPLIKSEQNFVLDRKLISIHSVDRDYQKWPNSNNFGVDLGEAFLNVQSMRLINFCLPSNNYTFSEYYQNTKMSFEYTDVSGVGVGTSAPWIRVTLPEGSYSPANLAAALQSIMNKAVWNGLVTNGDPPGRAPFVVKYNQVKNKLFIGVTEGSFKLHFDVQEIYTPTCDVNKAIFNQYTKWGLPSYLGFNKELYDCSSVDISSNSYLKNIGGLYFDYEDPTAWLSPTIDISGDNQKVCYVEAPCNLDSQGEEAIYMEVDKYNSIDEIYPYSERTGHLYNNDLGHRVNGSFAKIPLVGNIFTQQSGARNTVPLNVFHSEPPIQRIDRLKFKFRYHDGRLVDFKCLPFSFTLEFNMLKDEQIRGKRVRVPPLYNV